QGAHTIVAKVTDVAGNTGSSAGVAYTLDTVAPGVTQQLLHDTGPSAVDKITSDATLTGSGDPNALVTFMIDGVAVGETATADGSGAWTFTPLGLADGAHTIVASQTDGAGNTGTASLTFMLDTAAPAVASITATTPSQPEGNTGATLYTFLVQLDKAPTFSQTMSWAVTGSGTNAANATDFVGGALPSGTVTIEAGQTSAIITVKVQGDKATELAEEFTVTLSEPSVGVTIGTASATATIANDDAAAIDGYIAGATVFADGNGNGKLDPGEASTTTDENGNFTPPAGSGPLVVIGGIDVSTGLAFVGSLSAPAGSSVITPVTTLITALQASGIADLAEAQQVASQILGLDPGIDTLNVDPIAAAVAGDEAAAAAVVAGAKLLDTAQLIISAVGDGGDKAAALSNVFGAMAAAIGDLDGGQQYDLSNTQTLTTLVNDVATAQGTDASAFADDLATIIAASNASLDQKLAENSSGLALFTDISAVARVAQGETANDLQAAAGDPTQIAAAVADHTGDSLANAIAVAAVEVAPATVSVVVDAEVQSEGDSGTRTYTFTLTLDHASISSQTVVWSVEGTGANAATALDFSDGVLPGGIVTFATGETSKTIEVSVAGDTTVEADEAFALALSEPSLGLIIGTASTVATIVNDDTSVSIAALLASKVEGNAGPTAFTFTVTRSGDTSGVSSVAYAVAGSGVTPVDAADLAGGALPSGVVTFAAGETVSTITVAVAGDATIEPDNGFVVTLSTPSDGTTIGTASAIGTVLNDDLRSYGDAYVVLQGDTLTVSASAGVLANDDISPPATATVQGTTTHGLLQLAADGAVTYDPNAGFAGIDSFTYHAGGANGAADDAQAVVYVVPVQVGPTTTTLNLVALSAEEQIAATYVAFFGRGADARGFEFWVDQFHGNQATQGPAALFANIASSFGVSAEAKALYPFLVDPFNASDAQIGAFLDTVYDNLFNRTADADGLNYWVNQIKTTLAAGQFVGTVLVDIMSGAQNTANGQDITSLMGKVAVGLEYVHEQQEHDMQWAGDADLAAARALLDFVTSDAQSILTGLRNADTIVENHA
ncbi:Calx-beta domain-containing protein, partial [Reyranella sp.]